MKRNGFLNGEITTALHRTKRERALLLLLLLLPLTRSALSISLQGFGDCSCFFSVTAMVSSTKLKSVDFYRYDPLISLAHFLDSKCLITRIYSISPLMHVRMFIHFGLCVMNCAFWLFGNFVNMNFRVIRWWSDFCCSGKFREIWRRHLYQALVYPL